MFTTFHDERGMTLTELMLAVGLAITVMGLSVGGVMSMVKTTRADGGLAEAMEAFELSLKRTPRRTLSLLGLARAAMAAKDIATAQRAYGELRDIWKKADKTLPELKELGLVPPPSSH